MWKQRLRGGQPITLEFRSRRVLLRYADVLRLMEMAGASGQSFVFIWDVGQYVVIFDHENDPHDFTPVFGYNNPSDDRYTGRINLVSIGRA
ncbi:MAG: hypothetical protein GY862_32255 [Gammaproteobacteria bacterium]|nr:hypothetical protein [Gammaproteobacteria bacterium]